MKMKGTALSLASLDDIHSGDGLPFSVVSVSDSITDDIFLENFEDFEDSVVDPDATTDFEED